MIAEFHLTPARPDVSPMALSYRPRKNLVALKYFGLLMKFLKNQKKVDAELSYWNFAIEKDQKFDYVSDLQKHLDVLKIEPLIDMNYTVSMEDDQQKLNVIHDKFEFYLKQILSGELKSSHREVIEPSLLQINLLIHKIENFNSLQHQIETRGKDYIDCAFGFRFEEDEFFDLEEHDYDHFTLDRPFGSLSCGYNTTGKNFLHVMNDNDIDLISKKKVSPQKTFSTEGFFWFGPSIDGDGEMKRLSDWWNKQNVDQFGYKFYDRKNSIGMLPLADLIEPEVFRGKSHWEKLLILNKYKGIQEVKILH